MNDINTLEEKMAEACKKGTNAGRIIYLSSTWISLVKLGGKMK